ncbi:MAG: hypothetical protein HY342_12475 [Candidatus Lambdaproteobacteria bacterium]|nr:hypothetical protein [Candidatus Lambdaproteobacteria bacterium]
MVALALLSVVLTLIYAAFSNISGNAIRLTRETEARQNLRVLLRLITDDLQGAQYLKNFASNERASGIASRLAYTEDKQYTHISLHAAVPARFHRQVAEGGDPGLHEIGYQVERERELDTIVLVRREDFYLDDDLGAGGISVAIADRIEEFKVEFLRANANPQVTADDWLDEWDSMQAPNSGRLPAAMRLTISQRGPDDKVYTESIEFNLLQGLTSS